METKRYIAIDTETTGLDLWHGDKPFAISLCDDMGKQWYWEWDVDPYKRVPRIVPSDLVILRNILGQYQGYVFHNAKFDIRALSNIGCNWTAEDWENTHDTLLMSHILNSGESHGLKALSKKYLHLDDDDQYAMLEKIKECRRRASAQMICFQAHPEVAADSWLLRVMDKHSNLVKTYCMRDTQRTMGLFRFYNLIFKDKAPELFHFYHRERALLPVLYKMEGHGINVKVEALKETASILSKDISEKRSLLEHVAAAFQLPSPFNPNSNQQLAALLFEKMKLPIVKWTKGGAKKGPAPSCDVEAIAILSQKVEEGSAPLAILTAIAGHRKAVTEENYLTQYAESMVDKKVHTNLNQVGTRTTRFASSNVNLQNVEKKKGGLRRIFGPERGRVWLCADYNQLELRILAVAAQEDRMQQAFEEGADIHQWTADLCGIDRKPAKNANYAAVYGAGKEKLAAMTGVENMGQLFFDAYPGIKRFTYNTISAAKRFGYIETLFGYRLYVEEDRAYAGVDYVIQGTAGDILKYAMLNVQEALPRDCRMLMTIHDELVIDMPSPKIRNKKLLHRISECMMQPGLEVDIHTPVTLSTVTSTGNWSEPVEKGE